jgi:tyrosyl-tRNA synthetase
MLEAVIANAPSTTIGRERLVDPLRVVELLAETGVCASLGEARRAISQGGIYVNDLRVAGDDATVGVKDLLHDRYLLLRRGKRHPHVVVAR